MNTKLEGARTGAKAWVARVVGADLERSVYVWIASLLYLAVCLLWQPLPGMVGGGMKAHSISKGAKSVGRMLTGGDSGGDEDNSGPGNAEDSDSGVRK